jgi:hypothetical protein
VTLAQTFQQLRTPNSVITDTAWIVFTYRGQGAELECGPHVIQMVQCLIKGTTASKTTPNIDEMGFMIEANFSLRLA